jgi:ABC-type lipoprotein release transport system permease subunit
MNTFRIGWRNIWRNGKRTWITVVAIALNTAILIVSYALMQGMMVDMVDNATRMVVGDAQVHAPGYRLDQSMYKCIKEPEKIVDAARKAGIQAAARSYGFGLISSGSKSAGGIFWGVDPAAEQKSFELSKHMLIGEYLSAEPGKNVVLGQKLAKSLHADVGSEIVAVVQAADGSLGNELFTVCGILKVAGEKIDRGGAIIHRADFEELFVSGGRVHEIALNAWGKLSAEEVAGVASVAAGDDEVKTWKQLMPLLFEMVKMFDVAIFIFGLVFFLAAGLGVMNTMLMATYERIREFGIQKAMGSTPWRIMKDVSIEAFVMAVFSTLIGAAIGVAAGLYFQEYGINLEAMARETITFSGIAFDPLWRATLSGKIVMLPVFVMWIICVVAALYPAGKAARLNPVRAMTHV